MYFNLQSTHTTKSLLSRKPSFLSCTAERERNTWRLQEEVLQMERKVATAQRQARLALDRAMSAEIEAEQVPVLQQQLSDAKATLEEQIHRQDEARVSTQQQFHQMKSTLEHQLQEKDHQLEKNEQIRMTLEAQIQTKDQEKGKLERQLYMKDEHIRSLQISIRQDTLSLSSYVGKVHSLKTLNSVSSKISQLLLQ